ncbi:MAG: transketolase [Coriobacteriaceae bacterium]|nr:transketolase [Coriobacteriaceae bacterium]
MTNSPADIQARATNMRVNIIKMLHEAGSGHPGGSLSAADIVATLYFGGVMNVNPDDPSDPSRDRFILCKGHAAPVLYAALAELGYIPEEELLTLRKLHSRLQGHPDSKKLPGVEACTGSLGQGLSIAAGLALGLRLNAGGAAPQRVYALMGDGEIEEGQVWEAAMFAAHYGLDNLVAIVDNNNLQIDGDVREVVGLRAIPEKFRAFGWEVLEVDGHDVEALLEAFATAQGASGKPVCIVASTVKGKGVSFMENQAGWHGKAPNDEQAQQAIAELKGE